MVRFARSKSPDNLPRSIKAFSDFPREILIEVDTDHLISLCYYSIIAIENMEANNDHNEIYSIFRGNSSLSEQFLDRIMWKAKIIRTNLTTITVKRILTIIGMTKIKQKPVNEIYEEISKFYGDIHPSVIMGFIKWVITGLTKSEWYFTKRKAGYDFGERSQEDIFTNLAEWVRYTIRNNIIK